MHELSQLMPPLQDLKEGLKGTHAKKVRHQEQGHTSGDHGSRRLPLFLQVGCWSCAIHAIHDPGSRAPDATMRGLRCRVQGLRF